MFEMHFRQARFTYGTCRPFNKTKIKCTNLRKQDSNIYLSKGSRLSLLSTWHGLWRF